MKLQIVWQDVLQGFLFLMVFCGLLFLVYNQGQNPANTSLGFVLLVLGVFLAIMSKVLASQMAGLGERLTVRARVSFWQTFGKRRLHLFYLWTGTLLVLTGIALIMRG